MEESSASEDLANKETSPYSDWDAIEVQDFLNSLRKASTVAIDTETTGLKITTVDHAIGLSVAFLDESRKIQAMYFPYGHVDSVNNIPAWLKHELKEIIEDIPTAVFHHAKFDIPSLESLGINVEGRFICTLVLAHLVNENKPWNGKGLDALAKHYLGPNRGKLKMPGFDEYVASIGWGNVPYFLMKDYATHDAVLTLELAYKLWPLYKAECEDKLKGETSVWDRKQKLIRVLIQMNKWGVAVDTKRCEELIAQGEVAMEEAQKALGGVNPSSPLQLKELLIDRLGLPVLAWTKPAKGKDPAQHVPKPSFTKAVMPDYERLLEEIGDSSDIAANIIKFRGWQKSVSAFYRAWLNHLSPDGRLRPNYVMHKDPDDGGTVTGRLSCREPNLQQIPRITKQPWNKDVKKCLIPAPGYVLVEADYSQLELRLGTAYAKELSLAQVFEEGRDIFTEMSERLNMTRDATKTFVYSTQYGAGINRISSVFKITKSQAEALRQHYYRTYPGFRALSDKASTVAKTVGKVRLWSGRYRHFLKPQEEAHKAMNSLIQGGAADIVESVMIECFEEFVNEDCRLLLQVHDSLVFEIKEDQLQHYAKLIRSTMEGVNEHTHKFGVKFAVDVHYLGGDAVEIKNEAQEV